ncbi:MAG: ATP-dependent DNA helicase RecG [Clostridia bacterium]
MNKNIDLNSDITYINGIGQVKAELFNKLNIYNVYDLLTYYPRTYEDRTTLKKIGEFVNNDFVLFVAFVRNEVSCKYLKKNLSLYNTVVYDETGSVNMTWFNIKQVKTMLKEGTEYVFYGKVIYDNGFLKIDNAAIYNKYELMKIMGVYPIYPLCKGLTGRYFFNIVNNLLDSNIVLNETLNDYITKKYNLCSINFAVKNIHLPKNFTDVAIARKRIIFEELFLTIIALSLIKKKNKSLSKGNMLKDFDITSFLDIIPFDLTMSQNNVLNEIMSDMKSDKVMNRMIQGDVGSGKTIIAAIAMYIAVKNGFQAALMAPTTILASQHYSDLKVYFDKLNISCDIITSSTTKKNKEKIIEKLKSNELDIIIGTHSLIQDDVIFNNLGLVITDEQHRFGVKQRIKLSNKSKNIDTLIMTATPIPRTLALMLYGDLDLSVINELPKGRQVISTFAVDETFESRINIFLGKEIDKERQVYVVCPLVEDNVDLELESVNTLYNKYIKSDLNKYKIEFIHGKMKNKEKDEIMNRFKNNEINILISTTVIEVGVNVPNATVMLIEDADRFGLAALHQLRGRVGRGEFKSYCILKSRAKSEKVFKRLKIMEKSNDGFYIAEKDLELRGPGDFFGIRQSGMPEFKLADLLTDMKLFKLASDAAKELLIDDPNLKKVENSNLKKEIISKFSEQIKNIGI